MYFDLAILTETLTGIGHVENPIEFSVTEMPHGRVRVDVPLMHNHSILVNITHAITKFST